MDSVKASPCIPTPFDLAETYLPHARKAVQVDRRQDFYDQNKCADMQPAVRRAIAEQVYSLAKLSYPKELRKSVHQRICADLHVNADKSQIYAKKAFFSAVAVSVEDLAR